jgi:hypothetical protein
VQAKKTLFFRVVSLGGEFVFCIASQAKKVATGHQSNLLASSAMATYLQ